MFNPKDNLPERGPNQPRRPNIALIFFLVIAGIFLAYLFRGDNTTVRSITYSEFSRFMEQDQVESVTIFSNNTIELTPVNNNKS